MFTGIIKELGTVVRIASTGTLKWLEIEAPLLTKDMEIGDSISVSGACLTVVEKTSPRFAVEMMQETLEKTTLGLLRPGQKVNLESSLSLKDKMGGHWVLGHVDGVGEVKELRWVGQSLLFTVSLSEELTKYLVPKGSVCIDGVSLTVVTYDESSFAVSLIPHTLQQTTLGMRQVGNKVNIEMDILGKFVYHYIESRWAKAPPSQGITMEFLQREGYSE